MNENENRNASELARSNMGLVHACANRFRNRGAEYDDIVQAGCVGLVKAAKGFDPEMGFAFSTYAVPAILGEIKRIFRDGGAVKVSRSAKEKARELLAVRESLAAQLNREPTVSEIAEKVCMDATEASLLLCAVLPVQSLTPEEGDESEADIPVCGEDEEITDRVALTDALQQLEEAEQQLIRYRYYEGKTQTVTAQLLHMTQVQVSRKEKKILLKLRELLG